MNNVTADGSWDWSRVVRVPGRSIDVERFLLTPGDVLFNNTNSQELVGKTALFTGYPAPITFSNHFTRLRTGPELDSGYLAVWLHRLWQSGFFYRASTRWVGQAAVGTTQLLPLLVPLPDLEHQRRIATNVAAQREASRHARRGNDVARSVKQALTVATMERWFGKEPTKDWDRQPLAMVLRAPLRTGVSAPEVHEGGLPGLSLSAVRRGKLDLAETKRVAVPSSTNRLVREGRFYFVRGNGRLDLVGRAGLAPRPIRPIVFPDLLIEADVEPARLRADFFQLVWDSPEVRADIEARSRTASGIFKINLANLSRVRIPIPSLAEQGRVAAELLERLAIIDALGGSIETQREAIEAIPAALLRRAFEGLVA